MRRKNDKRTELTFEELRERNKRKFPNIPAKVDTTAPYCYVNKENVAPKSPVKPSSQEKSSFIRKSKERRSLPMNLEACRNSRHVSFLIECQVKLNSDFCKGQKGLQSISTDYNNNQ